jgi:hypothetical protein
MKTVIKSSIATHLFKNLLHIQSFIELNELVSSIEIDLSMMMYKSTGSVRSSANIN